MNYDVQVKIGDTWRDFGVTIMGHDEASAKKFADDSTRNCERGHQFRCVPLDPQSGAPMPPPMDGASE